MTAPVKKHAADSITRDLREIAALRLNKLCAHAIGLKLSLV
jgi:hypothetical protein